MDNEKDYWQTLATRLIRVEMERHGLTYKLLALQLKKVAGVDINHRTLTSAIDRGTYSAPLLLQIMRTLGMQALRVDWNEWDSVLGYPQSMSAAPPSPEVDAP